MLIHHQFFHIISNLCATNTNLKQSMCLLQALPTPYIYMAMVSKKRRSHFASNHEQEKMPMIILQAHLGFPSTMDIQ